MTLLDNFFIISPENWLFSNHGDVVAARRRAEEWLSEKARLCQFGNFVR